MKGFQLSRATLPAFLQELERELQAAGGFLEVDTRNLRTGRWNMARLWRAWMQPTTSYLVERGYHQALVLDPQGRPYGQRNLTEDDAHQAFTAMWLGVDRDGYRLSWSRTGRPGMRAADKRERLIALQRHQAWAQRRGVCLEVPAGCKIDVPDAPDAARDDQQRVLP